MESLEERDEVGYSPKKRKEQVAVVERTQGSNASSDNDDDEDLMDAQTKALFNQLMRTVDSDQDGKDPQKVSKAGGTKQDHSYKNKAYWNLPENVRNAIDLAKMKQKHSEFYYKLQTLNDKIYVFRTHFYTKMPAYQRAFLEKK